MTAARLSLWHEQVVADGDDLAPRPGLDGDTEADVAIVGAGFTGLWTAYHLLRGDPSLRVVVLERETAGFGGERAQRRLVLGAVPGGRGEADPPPRPRRRGGHGRRHA